jgi:3-deoxy-D-manno-octulosonate 8-phosphate phosphatase (KDO 8-P phosphatase)
MMKQNMNSKLEQARQKAAYIKLVIFDVDGVMSDGHIIYSSKGDELKAFHVKDGLGIKMLQKSGLITAIITGRHSELVKKRAEELKISHLVQGRDDKWSATQELISLLGISATEVAYIGDDLPDLAAIQYVGLGISVSDAMQYIKDHADYVTHAAGGYGAVREACEFILSSQNKLQMLIENYDLKNMAQ